MQWEVIESLVEEISEAQRKKILKLARSIQPGVTAEDVLQPNDFPALEENPVFRYEEGVLEGVLTLRSALLARQKEASECS